MNGLKKWVKVIIVFILIFLMVIEPGIGQIVLLLLPLFFLLSLLGEWLKHSPLSRQRELFFLFGCLYLFGAMTSVTEVRLILSLAALYTLYVIYDETMDY